MGFILFIYLALVTGFEAATENKTETDVKCSFERTKVCFNFISGLGTNFSAAYDQTDVDLNRTCSINVASKLFQTCLEAAPKQCNLTVAIAPQIAAIGVFVNNLCKNGTAEQKNFLNYTGECYNKYQVQRKNCVTKYSTTKTDAKSLCCESIKTQECLRNDLKNCSEKQINFQAMMIGTYSNYTNVVCAPYAELCNGAVVNFLSIASLLLTVKVILLNFV